VLHDDLSALQKVDIASSLTRLEQATHFFRFAGEWEAGQNVENFLPATDILQGALRTLTLYQSGLDLVTKFDESDLVGARSLQLWLLFLDN